MVYNAIAFLLSFERTGTFWTGYGFTLATIILTAGISFYALGREGILLSLLMSDEGLHELGILACIGGIATVFLSAISDRVGLKGKYKTMIEYEKAILEKRIKIKKKNKELC